ncbi:VOC family protein [Falsarthrobacter nasiphocae]|uniref:Enzyme related to lactoylglutathione lyase n=1 Tax=Falsarthrobacter nasiphocae TaxID=189863 RepID=A0AAE3YFJ7_9MICC|nr:VOC family protein [Falsarthrobacter nasiphocae]MDR6891244.1 putative enzyme related to lactoylglutathione lyase [Falsarthrobacter nasiphocae]
MSLRLSHTTWDALDPHTIAEFWRELLAWDVAESECYHPGSDECYLVSPDGHLILFYKVPDAKKLKNRAHMDFVPEGASRDEEVDRAVTLGATMVDDRRGDLGWAVMADPEGNEFCILNGGS